MGTGREGWERDGRRGGAHCWSLGEGSYILDIERKDIPASLTILV